MQYLNDLIWRLLALSITNTSQSHSFYIFQNTLITLTSVWISKNGIKHHLPLQLLSLTFIICSEFYLSFSMKIILQPCLQSSAPTIPQVTKPSERAFCTGLAHPPLTHSLQERSLLLCLIQKRWVFSGMFSTAFARWKPHEGEEFYMFLFVFGVASVVPHKSALVHRNIQNVYQWS